MLRGGHPARLSCLLHCSTLRLSPRPLGVRGLRFKNPMRHVLIATSNPGKLRDFAAAAKPHGIEVLGIPGLDSLAPAVEDGATFEENARKKATHYSRLVPGELVLADDSGLEVDALAGAPGVHSARYASPGSAPGNAGDLANNRRLLLELSGVPDEKRTARFVAVIAVARSGEALATFCGTVEGRIIEELRGSSGFGYDPLFFVPELDRTFGEVSLDEKARLSHRGQAFGA